MGVDSRARHLVEALHPTDRAHLSGASSVTRWMIASSQGVAEAASAVQPPVHGRVAASPGSRGSRAVNNASVSPATKRRRPGLWR